MLLLQQFGVAFPHNLLNSSSLLNSLEKLTPLLAALKAAKSNICQSTGLLPIFVNIQRSGHTLRCSSLFPSSLLFISCHSNPVSSLLSEKEKYKTKLSECPFTNLQRINLSTKYQAPKLPTSKTGFYLHTEQQCITSEKFREKGAFCNICISSCILILSFFIPAWKLVHENIFIYVY